MDVLHGLLKWCDYNRGLVVGIVIGLALCIGFASCTPKTGSLFTPGKEVTSAELDREIITLEAQVKAAEAAKEDLQRQYELRAKIAAIAGGLGQAAATGVVSPETAIAGVVQAFTLCAGIGAIADSRRKNKVIAAAKKTG